MTVMALTKLSARLLAPLPGLAYSVAAFTVTLPVKVLDPVRVRVPPLPVPGLTVKPPLPEITPETVPAVTPPWSYQLRRPIVRLEFAFKMIGPETMPPVPFSKLRTLLVAPATLMSWVKETPLLTAISPWSAINKLASAPNAPLAPYSRMPPSFNVRLPL